VEICALHPTEAPWPGKPSQLPAVAAPIAGQMPASKSSVAGVKIKRKNLLNDLSILVHPGN
jgi:hypothetical protein